MGNWHVTIIGGGIHGNNLHADVEQIIARCVKELRAGGHSVTSATVTSGSAVAVAGEPDANYMPVQLAEAPTRDFGGVAEHAAKRAYTRYVEHAGGVNYQGLPCPSWDQLPEAIRQHWVASVTHV